ncbi:MAG: HAD family phosphatase [Candidatus Daviesbacteria bacterium]|nr:HAD family phosphatase [Candidatus Daviesbacteria bacterium]
MIKAIIFDNAGVIMTEAYWLWLHKNIPNLEKRRDFFHDISYKVDSSSISPDQFLNYLAKESGKEAKQVKKEILSTFVLNKEVYKLMKKLKRNYKIGLLSNFISEWLKILLKKFNIKEVFDAMIVSTEHKMIKPDPKMYQLIAEMLGVKPQEAVFIDDRESNITGAVNVGMKGILFNNPQDLKEKLKKLGITI